MKNIILTCSLAAAVALPSLSHALIVNVTQDDLSISNIARVNSTASPVEQSDSYAGNGWLGGDVESFVQAQTDDYYQEGASSFRFMAPNEIYHSASAFSMPEFSDDGTDAGYARVRTSWDVAFNTEGGGILDLNMMNTNLDLPVDPEGESISWGSYQVTDTSTGSILADTVNGSFNTIALADGGSYSLSMNLSVNSHWDDPAFFTAAFFGEGFSSDISIVDAIDSTGSLDPADPVGVPAPAGLPLILLSLFAAFKLRSRR